MTRCAYLVPIFFANPIFKSLFTACGVMPAPGPLKMAIELCFITAGLAMAGPLVCAIYPQYPRVAVSSLEKEVQMAVGGGHEYLVYNKGI